MLDLKGVVDSGLSAAAVCLSYTVISVYKLHCYQCV